MRQECCGIDASGAQSGWRKTQQIDQITKGTCRVDGTFGLQHRHNRRPVEAHTAAASYGLNGIKIGLQASLDNQALPQRFTQYREGELDLLSLRVADADSPTGDQAGARSGRRAASGLGSGAIEEPRAIERL